MPGAAVVTRKDQVIFTVPKPWLILTDDVIAGMAWWAVMEILLDVRAEQQLIIVSPARNVDITLVHSAVDLMALERRCECENCVLGWRKALKALESGESGPIIIGYYEYDEMVQLTVEPRPQ